MKKNPVSPVTISNCFLPFSHCFLAVMVYQITLKMFILRHMSLSKREVTSDFLFNNTLHD